MNTPLPVLLTVFLTLGLLRPAWGGLPPGGFRLGSDIPETAEQVGPWSAAEGVISCPTVGDNGRGLLLVGDASGNDYTIRAKVRMREPVRGAEAGFALQARDATNYVVFSIASRRSAPYAVLRIENSEGSKLVGDQSPLPKLDVTEWHELRADVHGTRTACQLDRRTVA